MAAIASVSSAYLLAIAFVVRNHVTPATPRWVAAVAAVPIADSAARLAVTGDLRQTTMLMLVLVAIGAGVAARLAAASLVGAGVFAWIGVVLVRHTPTTRSGAEVRHYAIQLATAVLLAGALHAIRCRREAALREARDELADRVIELATVQAAQADSETRYRTVFDASPVGIALVDENWCFAATNDALRRLLGRTEADLLGRSSVSFTHPEDLPYHTQAGKLLAAAEDGVLRMELRCLRPDGTVRWVWLTIAYAPAPFGRKWTLAHAQDTTERREAEQAVRESEANLAAAARVLRRIQRGEDARSAIVDATKELAGATYACLLEPDLLGDLVVKAATETALINTHIPLTATSATVKVFSTGRAMFISDADEHPLISPGLMRLTGAKSVYLMPVSYRDNIAGVLVAGWGFRVPDIAGGPARAVELLADEAGIALEQAALVAELERLAATDSLTGLPNRRGWQTQLDYLIENARRNGTPLTIAVADLDHFKAYNDHYGHPAGDAFLRGFSDAARSALRAVDTFARWGGEEFAIGLPDCPAAHASLVLDRVRAAVPGNQTCSIGFATWDTVETPDELMQRADEALYAAKRNGRNRSQAHIRP
jgi:diguanylate cyclase (GGDEF)-like protein/PAS domain S-box-containing protein